MNSQVRRRIKLEVRKRLFGMKLSTSQIQRGVLRLVVLTTARDVLLDLYNEELNAAVTDVMTPMEVKTE